MKGMVTSLLVHKIVYQMFYKMADGNGFSVWLEASAYSYSKLMA